jgi:hypothetical protein
MRTIQLEQYEEKADSSGCVALWRAVIYRALCDACYQYFDQFQLEKHARNPNTYITRENRALAERARQFLLEDQTRFTAVCNLALLDPAWVRKRARN